MDADVAEKYKFAKVWAVRIMQAIRDGQPALPPPELSEIGEGAPSRPDESDLHFVPNRYTTSVRMKQSKHACSLRHRLPARDILPTRPSSARAGVSVQWRR